MVSGASGAARSQKLLTRMMRASSGKKLLPKFLSRRNNGKGRIQSALASAHSRNGKRRVETCSAVQRRTRRSVSTIGGAAPDTIIGRATADRAGARPYRATRCENASICATPDRAGARPISIYLIIALIGKVVLVRSRDGKDGESPIQRGLPNGFVFA